MGCMLSRKYNTYFSSFFSWSFHLLQERLLLHHHILVAALHLEVVDLLVVLLLLHRLEVVVVALLHLHLHLHLVVVDLLARLDIAHLLQRLPEVVDHQLVVALRLITQITISVSNVDD